MEFILFYIVFFINRMKYFIYLIIYFIHLFNFLAWLENKSYMKGQVDHTVAEQYCNWRSHIPIMDGKICM